MVRRIHNTWLGVASILVLLLLFGGIASAKVEITYVNWYGRQNLIEGEQKVIDLFNERNADIAVKWLQVDWDQLLVQVAAGTPPDVAAIRGARVAPMLTQLAEDLTGYITRDNFALSALRPGIDAFIRGGRIYGLPWGAGGTLLLYNKSMFDRRGLPQPNPNWTWSDHAGYVQRLSRDISGDGVNDQFGHAFLYSPLEATVEYTASFGGVLVDRNTGLSGIDRPAFIQGLAWLADLRSRQMVTEGGEAFSAGQAAMVGVWEGDVPDWAASAQGVELRGVVFPQGSLGSFSSYVTHPIAIVKGSKHPEAGWKFIKFYNSPEAQEILARYGVYPATRYGIRAMVESIKLPAGYAVRDFFMPVLEPAKPVNPAWEVPGYFDVSQLVTTAMTDIYAGKRSARAAMVELAPQANALLREAKAKFREETK